MFEKCIVTDANGFVLFAPETLARVLGRAPLPNENLLLAFKRSTLGDEVLKLGAIVPVYPLTDGRYNLCVRLASEPRASFASERPDATVESYTLDVQSRAIVGDLALLQEWLPELGWHSVAIPPGFYSARVFAYRGEPDSGFEIVLSRENELPPLSAEWGQSLDVDNATEDSG